MTLASSAIAAIPLPVVAGLVLALAAACYAVSCLLWPLAHCLRCDGSGRRARADGRVWRPCRRCKGTGRRWRWGRRLWSFWARRDL